MQNICAKAEFVRVMQKRARNIIASRVNLATSPGENYMAIVYGMDMELRVIFGNHRDSFRFQPNVFLFCPPVQFVSVQLGPVRHWRSFE
jgi:hypothetical protein